MISRRTVIASMAAMAIPLPVLAQTSEQDLTPDWLKAIRVTACRRLNIDPSKSFNKDRIRGMLLSEALWKIEEDGNLSRLFKEEDILNDILAFAKPFNSVSFLQIAASPVEMGRKDNLRFARVAFTVTIG